MRTKTEIEIDLRILLQDTDHGPTCAVRFHGAAECTCGKTDRLSALEDELATVTTLPRRKTYKLDFTGEQWEELVAMTFEPFEFREGEALTRRQWMALAHMATGKAQRITAGNYGTDCENDEEIDFGSWAEELQGIAEIILNCFQPGDGKL